MIELFNGAFVADFQKGEKGKPGTWKMTPVLDKIGKKEEHKHDGKEVPQYPIINDIETAAKTRFQNTLKEGILEVTKYLKQLSK